MMSIETKRDEHRRAQEVRRALEAEQGDLPGQLNAAVTAADVATIHALNRRKRELPADIQAASAVEHALYGALVREEQAAALHRYEEAQTELDEAEAELFAHRSEAAQKDRELAARVDKAMVARNSQQNEHETWATRFTVASNRYREVVGQQQEAA